jgi:uncharacterized protein YciI
MYFAITIVYLQALRGYPVFLPYGGLRMLYAVLFTDNAAHAEARARLMPAHLEFLERHRDWIRAAGPLRDAADGSAAGGLWLVDADNAEAVIELYKGDPFWSTGLRQSIRVLQWSQVFADGRRIA